MKTGDGKEMKNPKIEKELFHLKSQLIPAPNQNRQQDRGRLLRPGTLKKRAIKRTTQFFNGTETTGKTGRKVEIIKRLKTTASNQA